MPAVAEKKPAAAKKDAVTSYVEPYLNSLAEKQRMDTEAALTQYRSMVVALADGEQPSEDGEFVFEVLDTLGVSLDTMRADVQALLSARAMESQILTRDQLDALTKQGKAATDLATELQARIPLLRGEASNCQRQRSQSAMVQGELNRLKQANARLWGATAAMQQQVKPASQAALSQRELALRNAILVPGA